MSSKKIVLLYIALFLLAFLPRAIYPVSRPNQWYWRPLFFYRSLKDLDFKSTYQSEHPGVTFMWLAGPAEIAYKIIHQYPEYIPSDNIPPYLVKIPAEAIQWGIIPIVGAISLGICFIFFLLKKLFSFPLAILATLFIALDPFSLTHSKTMHLDALLAIIMAISVLCFVLFQKSEKRRYLFFSGIFGGLAFLTKQPGFFLAPFVGLTFLIFQFDKIKNLSAFFKKMVQPLLVWLVLSAGTFVALFPAMWVIPIEVLSKMFTRGVGYATTAHPFPLFFMGKVTEETIGLPFYLALLVFCTTPLTIVSGAFSIPSILLEKKETSKRVIGALMLFCFFFLMVLGLVAKDGRRYLSPFFPVFDILAAYAFFEFASRIRFKKIALFGEALLIILNFATVLLLHPYYGNYYNPLFGGAKMADKVIGLGEQAEGVDLALKYLSQKKNAGLIQVGCSTPDMCLKYAPGKVYPANESEQRIDYYVFDRDKISRGFYLDQWDKYKNRKPEKTIEFGGITYVWVFRAI